MNLDGMSLDELKKLKKDVEKAITTYETRRRQEARKAMEKVAKEYGLSVDDVVGGAPKKATRTRSKGNAKYRNPDNTSQTWTGKGRQPQWFKDALSKGKSPDDLAV